MIARRIESNNKAARDADSKVRRIMTTINDYAHTVSDRVTGEFLGYVNPLWTEITAEELLGWWPWPVKLGETR